MSSTLVVLNDWLWRTQTKTPTRKTDLELLSQFSLCKPTETYIYARKKHPFASYSAAKHLKHSKFAITNIREKPVNFFYCSTRASTLVSAIYLKTQVPLQKFSFLFIIIISWLNKLPILELSALTTGKF